MLQVWKGRGREGERKRERGKEGKKEGGRERKRVEKGREEIIISNPPTMKLQT